MIITYYFFLALSKSAKYDIICATYGKEGFIYGKIPLYSNY